MSFVVRLLKAVNKLNCPGVNKVMAHMETVMADKNIFMEPVFCLVLLKKNELQVPPNVLYFYASRLFFVEV